MNIRLEIMTRQLCHRLFKEWENDEAIYADMSKFRKYIYDEEKVNAYFDARQDESRIVFAVMLGDMPIGEVQLKNIDLDKKSCSMSIHLQNDSVKGRGFGTQAERIAVDYAFNSLSLDTVFADTVIKNTRSSHVLEKVGFVLYDTDDMFRYYRIDKGQGKIDMGQVF